MVEPFSLADESYFIIDRWSKDYPELICGFTSKNGGASTGYYSSNNMGLHVGDVNESVVKNRTFIGEKLKFPLENWVGAQQTHGNKIYQVTKADRGKGSNDYRTSIQDRDGLFTDDKNILLVLAYADCVPIYFFAPEAKRIGIAHAGWRGTVQNIVSTMINEWKNDGINVEEILVTIGPSICNTCYIVDNRVIEHVQALPIASKEFYSSCGNNQFHLDLKGLNKALLLQEGVLEQNILVTNLCTSCESQYFYSHRKDQGKTGRMLGFIGIREAAKN